MNKDKQLLKTAAHAIKELRQENKMLEMRLSGFEDALFLLKTAPNLPGYRMMDPDVAYELEKRVAEMEGEEHSELAGVDEEHTGGLHDLPGVRKQR